ncbi:uncharacterized protein G2W53_004128 [Senna tora]|uniref:Uncharacterized protein n=1 Tax=Senna tora TaxID=362788 RepID=A0A835CJ24_9FABA|nr:uncharacterized protein G2W53_004128 [Senna tora]
MDLRWKRSGGWVRIRGFGLVLRRGWRMLWGGKRMGGFGFGEGMKEVVWFWGLRREWRGFTGWKGMGEGLDSVLGLGKKAGVTVLVKFSGGVTGLGYGLLLKSLYDQHPLIISNLILSTSHAPPSYQTNDPLA